MIEVVLGLMVLLAAGAAAIGLASAFIPAPIELAGAYVLGTLGAVIYVHGVYRILLKREGADRDWVRSCGLIGAMLTLVAILSLLLPLCVPLLNAFKFAGFPFGFYMMAQGSLIMFVMIAFLHAARAEKQDRHREKQG
jgi:putative solute:sodium symporter small subunit